MAVRVALVVSLFARAPVSLAKEDLGGTCPQMGGHDIEEAALLQSRRELTEPEVKGHRGVGLAAESSRRGRSPPVLPAGVEKYMMQEAVTGLTFDCIRTANFNTSTAGAHRVLLLHGFPEGMWIYRDLLQLLYTHGHHGVSCMGRGYNSNATSNPEGKANYSFLELRSDVYRWAAHLGWSSFDLVGHDIGAILGWFCLQAGAFNPHNRDMITSFTSLSQPHNDHLNERIFWKDFPDWLQIALLQDWRAFVLPDSARIEDGFLYKRYDAAVYFATPQAFQKALWWFNGMLDIGVMGTPPLMTVQSIQASAEQSGVCECKLALSLHCDLRREFGDALHPDASDSGVRFVKDMNIGPVQTRVALVCGNDDSSVLCNKYAVATIKEVSKAHTPNSTHVMVDCGRRLLGDDCSHRVAVMHAALRNIENRNHE